MLKETQISAVVSRTTKELLDRHVRNKVIAGAAG